MLRLLEAILASGARVDALGLQAHLRGDRTDFDAGRFLGFVDSVLALDLKVLVTELDVGCAGAGILQALRNLILLAGHADAVIVNAALRGVSLATATIQCHR